jgi:hypothetical protein
LASIRSLVEADFRDKQAMSLPDKTLLAEIAACEALAEKSYDQMYDSRYPVAEYSDLKDHFADAIGLARRAGLTDEVERLSKRLEHCKAVYRSQFSQS